MRRYALTLGLVLLFNSVASAQPPIYGGGGAPWGGLPLAGGPPGIQPMILVPAPTTVIGSIRPDGVMYGGQARCSAYDSGPYLLGGMDGMTRRAGYFTMGYPPTTGGNGLGSSGVCAPGMLSAPQPLSMPVWSPPVTTPVNPPVTTPIIPPAIK